MTWTLTGVARNEATMESVLGFVLTAFPCSLVPLTSIETKGVAEVKAVRNSLQITFDVSDTYSSFFLSVNSQVQVLQQSILVVMLI
jgi:hypothetical protein